jgi:hypothetical protein
MTSSDEEIDRGMAILFDALKAAQKSAVAKRQ